MKKEAADRETLQEKENRIILDSVPAMIWYKDKKNRILRCNRAAAVSMGKTVAELEGADTYKLYPDEAAAYHKDDLEVIGSGRPKLGIIEQVITKHGKRWVSTDKIPYRDAKGKIIGVIVFALDITAQKQAEQVLKDSELAQKEFVANVSHELRTPVAAIKGYAETLRLGAVDDVKNRGRFLHIIESHADRLAWLIEDILTLSSFEGGRKLVLAPLGVREFVLSHVRSLAPLARSNKVTVTVAVAPSLKVMADRPHLIQALDNLYANAVKFNRPGGRIWITARRQAGFAHVTVRDNGIGIAPEALKRVFDRFYRVEKGASPGNSGLGLHIVKTIVEAHGGRVWAESVVGQGSSFHFSLPLAAKR